METKYCICIKKMASGDHEVHAEGCVWCQESDQVKAVGEFETPEEALESAKKIFPEANGCHCCMPEQYHLP